RAYARNRFSGEINPDNARHIDVIGLPEQLFYKLRSAFSHRHCPESSVSCMRIRTEDHTAAAREHFTRKLMDYCLVRRNIDSAVLFGTGKAKHMAILIDRTADCTQRIMAVCQHVRHREFFQS